MMLLSGSLVDYLQSFQIIFATGGPMVVDAGQNTDAVLADTKYESDASVL